MKIAITGTVGSGKSGVTKMLSGFLQCESIDTDQICRELLMEGELGFQALQQRWKDRFFLADGKLDRVALREAVFSEADIRSGLEEILHPLVKECVIQRFTLLHNECHILVEVPLLYEVGWNTDFDHVICVYAPDDICIERTVARDGVSREQAERILALQLSPEVKAQRADTVINNSGLWSSSVLQVSHWVGELGRRSSE